MKKKLLALILSAAMLTESVLPVVAADDVEVTASENAAEEVAEEVAEDVVAEEEPEAEEAEETAAEEVAETTEDEAGVKTDYVVISESEVMAGPVAVLFGTEDEAVQESEDVTAAGDNAVVGAAKTTSIDAGTITINDKNYSVNATIKYYSSISYRCRKIKPDKDLGATVTGSGLYNIARDLTTTGTFTPDVITWKMPAKKNTNAGTEASFNLKASVNSKVAKQLGIKGKSLSKLKKAVKQFNKVSTKKDAKNYFEITKINLARVYEKKEYFAWAHYVGWITYKFSSFKSLWVRLEPDQPKSVDEKTFKQLTKVKKSDFKITINKDFHIDGYSRAFVAITLTPKDKNFTGVPVTLIFEKSIF